MGKASSCYTDADGDPGTGKMSTSIDTVDILVDDKPEGHDGKVDSNVRGGRRKRTNEEKAKAREELQGLLCSSAHSIFAPEEIPSSKTKRVSAKKKDARRGRGRGHGGGGRMSKHLTPEAEGREGSDTGTRSKRPRTSPGSASSSTIGTGNGGSTGRSAPRELAPFKVENLAVHIESHLEQGEKKYYRRLTIECPESERHCGCSRRRNTGEAQTRLGPMEPYAFLGVWARCSPLCSDRLEHMEFEPPDDLVKAYMTEHHWL